MSEAELLSPSTQAPGIVEGLWGVRYQVSDVERSADFYTRQLGFALDHARMARLRNRADGTASSSRSPIFRLASRC